MDATDFRTLVLAEQERWGVMPGAESFLREGTVKDGMTGTVTVLIESKAPQSPPQPTKAESPDPSPHARLKYGRGATTVPEGTHRQLVESVNVPPGIHEKLAAAFGHVDLSEGKDAASPDLHLKLA